MPLLLANLVFFPAAPAADPHSGPATAAASGRGGITRLELSVLPSGGGTRAFQPLAVANLTALITFSLPPPTNMMVTQPQGAPSPFVDGLVGSLQAVCSFWDAAEGGGAGAYSTQGCVSQPSPLPPNMTAAWVPGFNATSPPLLAKARHPGAPAPLSDGPHACAAPNCALPQSASTSQYHSVLVSTTHRFPDQHR